MNLRRCARGAIACACIALGAATPAAAPAASAVEREKQPGEGVLCAWALISVVAEVAERCFPDKSPAMQAELRRSVGRLDTYVLKNGKDMSAAKIEEFKRRQGGVGAPLKGLCSGDAVELYDAFEKRGPNELRTIVDKAVERPGPPTLGTCT